MAKIKYNIPNLSNLHQYSHIFMYNRFFTGIGPSNYEAYALFMNYIRLADILLSEYENGRKILTDFLASKNNAFSTHLVIASSGHFEICINTLERVIKYFKKIRGDPKIPQSLKDSLPRNSKVLAGKVEGLVTKMRHAIEHLENQIQKGTITSGQALCIMPVEDGIELGKYKILFNDLAEWIEEMNNYSKVLVQYRESNN